VRGTFRGVVHGEFETGPRVPVVPLAVAALVVALLSWLVTVLLLLAVIAAVLALVLTATFLLLSRRNDRDAELLAERTAALHAEVTPRAAPAPVENHYHLHLSPGTDASGIDWAALPARDAVTIKED